MARALSDLINSGSNTGTVSKLEEIVNEMFATPDTQSSAGKRVCVICEDIQRDFRHMKTCIRQSQRAVRKLSDTGLSPLAECMKKMNDVLATYNAGTPIECALAQLQTAVADVNRQDAAMALTWLRKEHESRCVFIAQYNAVLDTLEDLAKVSFKMNDAQDSSS
jgi:hypothetical protein